MLYIFPITPHFEEKSLEGVSIIVAARWVAYVPFTIISGVLVSMLLNFWLPDFFKGETFAAILWYSVFGGWILLSARDVIMVRRFAKDWPDERIRSHEVIKKLPYVLLLLIPIYFLGEKVESQPDFFTWLSGMIWVFSCFAAIFYLVYFVLLFALFRMPTLLAFLGFCLAVYSMIDGFRGFISDERGPR